MRMGFLETIHYCGIKGNPSSIPSVDITLSLLTKEHKEVHHCDMGPLALRSVGEMSRIKVHSEGRHLVYNITNIGNQLLTSCKVL
jgi:hypothetical protein